ncbi:restriction endonuclease subunit S [Streptococcus suis]|uniref:restriction endonuclease subunit S n=1 Tax=Streptococcus suis TaxID=1307 RepID=UPI0037D23F2E
MGSYPTPPAKRRRRHKKALSPRLAKLDKEFEEAGGEWREYRIGDLFEKLELKCHRKNFDKLKDTSKVQSMEFSLPLVNAKLGNNGIMFYGREEDFDSAEMTIDIISNGAVATGTVYPQIKKVGVLWDAYLIKFKKEILPEHLIFISSALEKSIKLRFGWENKAVWTKVRREFFELPTINGKIAFSYMENYIKTLEAYLTVTGLKEYHLTKNDEKILDRFAKLSDTESRVEYLGILWEKFPVASLFDIQTSRSVDKGALDLSDEPKKYPFIGRTSQNNGVQGYLDYLGFSPNPKNTFSVIQIGENVAQFRNKEWYGSQNLFVLQPYTEKIIDANLFFTTCLNMSLLQFSSGYTNYPTLSKLKELELVLPVKEQQIDYTFMSDFIKVIEKLVIKDLVEWTDKKIQATKEVVAQH